MARYGDLFKAALDRTASLGFAVETFSPQLQKSQISEDDGMRLMNSLTNEFSSGGALSQDKVAFQCGQVSKAMQSHVNRVTGFQSVLTIGTVTKGGVPYWDVAENNLASMRLTGKYHVWLTLPGMEILDYTLNVSLRIQHGIDPSGARPIYGDPDSVHPYAWIPLIVGGDAALTFLGL